MKRVAGVAGMSRRPAVWLAPAIACLLLRAALQGHADEDTLQPLREAAQAASAEQVLWLAARPFAATAAALIALWLAARAALRRWPWPRLRPAVLALWLLLWLAAAAWLTADHLNRTGRAPLPEQTARVLLARPIAPSPRGPGGTELYLQTTPDAPPLRVLAESQPPETFPQGSTLTLHSWQGRWWGLWATVEH